jgi:hypothetical protein
MKNARKLLPLFMANALLNSVSTGHHNEPVFRLPDISDDERIRAHTLKVRKRHTKRRVNKLHERRRK